MKTLVRFLLGAVFIVSGAAKAIDTQTFISLIQGYDIGFLAYAAIIIPPLEILLGLFLWFNIQTKTAALVMMISTALFTLIFLDVLITKGIKDCGCFGSIKFLQMPPWGTVLRNILLMAGSYWLYRFPPAESRGNQKAKFIVISVIGFAAFTISAISFTKPLISVNTINNGGDLLGKDVDQTFLKDYHLDKNKRYAIFIFSPECFHCWDMTANVKSYTDAKFVDETIGIAPLDMIKSEKDYEDKLKPNFKINLITYKKFGEATSSTPLFIITQNNKIIVYNASGVIHSAFTINKFYK